MTEAGLTDFLRHQAIETWKFGQPYFLASVPGDLKPVDYKQILGTEKLKEFVRRTEGPDAYRLVEHPSQKAKIGIVPHEADFHFEVLEPHPEEPRTELPSARKNERPRVLLDFLHALAKLPDEDLDQIVIPTRVLVKLATRR